MKTFILVLLVGACLAATVKRPDFKRKRNEDAIGNPKRSPGKATRGILNLLRQNPRHARRESKNNDVDKRDYYYYDYYSDYEYYDVNYDTSYDYYYDNSWYYSWYDYYRGYWDGYWYGYYNGIDDGYDWGYVSGNENGFDLGFSNGYYDAVYKYSYYYPYYYKREVAGKRSGSPMKRSRRGQDSNAKLREALKTNENTEKYLVSHVRSDFAIMIQRRMEYSGEVNTTAK